MKNSLLTLAISVIFLLALSSSTCPEATFTLTVKVTHVVSSKGGHVEIGLYNCAENFPIVGKTYKTTRVKPAGSVVEHTFTGLKHGNYAVCIYHDTNDDKICNKNLIGVPTEAYAFSKDFRPKLSAPKFSDCLVLVSSNKTIWVKLIY